MTEKSIIKIENTKKIYEPDTSYFVHLYISPSPYPLNWSSPRSLFLSLIPNIISGLTGRRHIIQGHVNMELVYNTDRYALGMHYRYKKEGFNLVMRKKAGLGVFFHNLHGRFNTMKDIAIAREDFIYGQTSMITFIINEEQANLLKNYRENFLTTGEQYNYGLANNPLAGPSKSERTNFDIPQQQDGIKFGGGCSAFIISALDEIGAIDSDIFNIWSSSVEIPKSLIGRYSDDIYKKEVKMNDLFNPTKNINNPISVIQLLRKGSHWARPDEPNRSVIYYSPNLMNRWIRSYVENSNRLNNVLKGSLKKIFTLTYKKDKAYQIVIVTQK